ncbi:MAG: hypothetical protein NTX50_02990 [Candidatus Sumerlaeota bacterium]|nr:hypothetical protein [Candidatus Sumerlaeota bacterium]
MKRRYWSFGFAAIVIAALLASHDVAQGAPAATALSADFFRPGPVAPDTLPAQGIFPQGRTMHIGGYSPTIAPVKQLGDIIPMELAKKSGFTVAGPYYGAFAGSKANMERAAALGMHVAAQLEVPPALRFNKEEAKDALKLRGARMTALPEADLRKWIQEDMEQFLKNPELNRAVSCWAISPEELRFWVKAELNYEQAFVKAVNDFDPQHRPVYMYEPNNRNTTSLLKTGPGQGFVLEGAYVHSYGWDVRRALRINWAMDQMTSAAAQDKRIVVPGLQLSQDMPGFTAKDLESSPTARARLRRLLRHDVFLAIARGAQGFQVWSLFHSRKNMTTYLELVNGYGEVFREMAPPENLQAPILFGERRNDVTLELAEGPAFISAKETLDAVEGKVDVQKERWPSLRLANLAYSNERVLILVNSADQPVRARLGGIPVAARLIVVSGGDAAKIAGDSSYKPYLEIMLEPFAALVLRVEKSAE